MTAAATPLQLLVVSDPELAAGIGKQWAARSESPLVIREMSETALLSGLQADRMPLEKVDAIVYPSGLFGTLVSAERLAVLPESLIDRSAYDRDDIFPMLRGTAVRWGNQRFAIPLGMPVVMLAYRGDLLPVGSEVPVSWDAWDALMRDWDARVAGQGSASRTARPVLQTLGPSHAAVVFLARAAASVRHRSQYSTLFDANSMGARIDNPAFVQSLQRLVADCHAGGGPRFLTPEEACAELIAGHVAMVIGRPAFRLPISESESPRPDEAVRETVRFAPLPGDRSMYNAADDRWDDRRPDESPRVPLLGVGGRLGSVHQLSRQKRAAWNFLLLLSGPQWSEDISPSSMGTAPFRRSHQDGASGWTGPEWGRATVDSWYASLAANLAAKDWLHLPRIPGRRQYLSILDQAVREAAEGTRSPAEALSKVADQWNEVTASLGVESQKKAYRRSIGLDP